MRRGEKQTLEKKMKVKRERKKTYVDVRTKELIKITLHFLRKEELLMMSHCRKEFTYTHTSRFQLYTPKNTTT